MLRVNTALILPVVVSILLIGCAEEGPDDGTAPCVEGQKCDTPDDTPQHSCTKRRLDALEGNQSLFAPEAIRWPCADVEGVNTNNQDDRGQEYCEYFAVLKPPPETEGGAWPDPVTLGRITAVEEGNLGGIDVTTTASGLELTEDQIFYLEDFPDEVLGACVFTSWHEDVPGPVPACDEVCPDVLGVPIERDTFSMKLWTNSNVAAADLVRTCLEGTPREGEPSDAEDPLNSDFYRGCIMVSELYGTEWRRSDPAVCAAAMRLAECGCALPEGADVPTSLVPPQPVVDPDTGDEQITFRGFPLGGWTGVGNLPSGCRYATLGDESHTVVVCDLSANDIINNASDLKRRCVEKYGLDVIVHVPIPTDAITCSPPEGGTYADTCSAQPWVIDR